MKLFILISMALGSFAITSLGWTDTPADVLKRLYDEASAPAQMSDFAQSDFWGNSPSSSLTCTIYWNSQFSSFPIYRMVYVALSQGPLFPGYTEEKIMPFEWRQYFGAVTNSSTETDLIATVPEVGSTTDSQTGISTPGSMNIQMRKSGNYIAFKTISSWGGSAYGYCYPKDQSLF